MIEPEFFDTLDDSEEDFFTGTGLEEPARPDPIKLEAGGVTVWHSLPFTDYLKIDAVNHSSLKYMDLSGLHYEHVVSEGTEDRHTFRVGRSFHAAVLEPHLIEPIKAVCPPDGMARNMKHQKYREFLETVPSGYEVLSASEMHDLRQAREADGKLAKAVRTDPEAGRFFVGEFFVELTIIWTDPDTGLLCKARPDILHKELGPADLKSAETASPEAFERTAVRMHYTSQSAFYLRGLEAAIKAGLLSTKRPRSFTFLACEKAPPFGVSTLEADEGFLLYGDDLVAGWMQELAKCREQNRFPGYGRATLSIPGYLKKRMEDDAMGGMAW